MGRFPGKTFTYTVARWSGLRISHENCEVGKQKSRHCQLLPNTKIRSVLVRGRRIHHTRIILVKGNSFGLTVCYKLTKCGCFLGFSGAASWPSFISRIHASMSSDSMQYPYHSIAKEHFDSVSISHRLFHGQLISCGFVSWNRQIADSLLTARAVGKWLLTTWKDEQRRIV